VDSDVFFGARLNLASTLDARSNVAIGGELVVGGDADFLGSTVRVKKLIVDDLEVMHSLYGAGISNINYNGGGGSGGGGNYTGATFSNCTLVGTTRLCESEIHVQAPLYLHSNLYVLNGGETHFAGVVSSAQALRAPEISAAVPGGLVAVKGPVDMLTGQVHIRDLLVDSVTLSSYRYHNHEHDHAQCCSSSSGTMVPTTLPPTFPSDANGSVDKILGDLVVDGFVCARKGFCGPAYFFCGVNVYGGESTFGGPVSMQSLGVQSVAAQSISTQSLEVQDFKIMGSVTLANPVALPQPGTRGGHVDQFHGDVIIDGNVYVRGGVASGDSNYVIWSTSSTSSSSTSSSSTSSSSTSSSSSSTSSRLQTQDFTVEQTGSNLSIISTPDANATTIISKTNLILRPTSFEDTVSSHDNLTDSIRAEVGSTAEQQLRAPMLMRSDPAPATSSSGGGLLRVSVTQVPSDPRVMGVFTRMSSADEVRLGGPIYLHNSTSTSVSTSATDNTLLVALVQTRGLCDVAVCEENGMVRNGDLLTSSSKPGVAMRQIDDIVRSSTVAKCIQDAASSSSEDETLIAQCILMIS
jgi:hypothetical protein